MTPIDAQTPISVTLAAEAWNGVLSILGDAPVPYKFSAPLIQAIGQQLQQAAQEAAPKPNGAERPQYVPAA